jgi:hypothetical protein
MSQAMIAMLEEAEDVLRRAGCDMTADRVRGVLQAQQAEPVARDVQVELDDEDIINIADASGFDINTPEGVIELCKAVASYAAQPPAVAVPLSAALADIAAERRRQVEQERWTPDRDDRLLNGQLATAAGYYALAAGWPHERDIGRGLKPQYWPFNQEWWKPTTARHNLVKAGALIAAEIERLDRAAQKGGA